MEAIDAVRTSLFNLGASAPPPKVLAVTSAMPSEGKSTTALYFACVLAQHQARVLLVDGDLRRGTLAPKLGMSSNPGLGDILAGLCPLLEAVQPVSSIPGLSVLASGLKPTVRASVLLDSPAMTTLIASAREKFDYIVFNGPPVLGLSDVLSLGQHIDGSILVLRNGITLRKMVKRAETVLRTAGVPVYGYVLNDVSLSSQGFARRGYRKTYSVAAKGTA